MSKGFIVTGFVFLISLFTACTSPPPLSSLSGTITQLKFEDECFDLDTGRIEKSESIAARCLYKEWDLVFAYDGYKKPHARLLIKPLSEVKAAYLDKNYASVSLKDVQGATFTSTIFEQPIETAIIQTSNNTFFKIHVLGEKGHHVTFEWEKLQ
jgi:hypothetical protein